MGAQKGETLALMAYLLLGSATLFPWNSLLTAADYWEAQYPGKHVDRLFTVCYLPTNLAVLAAMIHWHAAILPRLRIVTGLAGFTLAMLAVPLLDMLGASASTLACLLLLVACVGACDGVAQGALFGEAALLPPRYTGALISGTSLSGVVVSLLRIATKATLPNTPSGLRASATVYFLIAAAVTGCATVVYLLLPRLGAIRRHRQAALEAALDTATHLRLATNAEAAADVQPRQHQQHQQHSGYLASPADSKWQGTGNSDVELSYEDHVQAEQQQRRYAEQQGAGSEGWVGQQLLVHGQPHGSSAELDGESHQYSQGGGQDSAWARCEGWEPSYLTVARQIWRLAAANILIYVVTLSIFPGVLAEDVHSADLGSWYPVLLLTLFNVADWAGKSLPTFSQLRARSPSGLLSATLARLLFVPAFHLAATHSATAVICLLALLLGLSNGYLTSCVMIRGPEGLAGTPAALAGNLMVLRSSWGSALAPPSVFSGSCNLSCTQLLQSWHIFWQQSKCGGCRGFPGGWGRECRRAGQLLKLAVAP